MYPLCGAFGNAVNRMRLLPSHTYLDNAGIVFDKLSDGFSTQAPHARQFTNPVVLFESCVPQ